MSFDAINSFSSSRITGPVIPQAQSTEAVLSDKSSLQDGLLSDSKAGSVSFNTLAATAEQESSSVSEPQEKPSMGKLEKGLATAAGGLSIAGIPLGVVAPPLGGALSVAGIGLDLGLIVYAGVKGYPREAALYCFAGPLAGPINKILPDDISGKVKSLITSAA
jgi:hypothetical protein